MASTVIHMCVAKEVAKILHLPEEKLFLGSIAPDISKHIGKTKEKSHFFDRNNKINIEAFLEKYPNCFQSTFLTGYFIHLYTDILWEEYFISEIVEKGSIHLLNGEEVEANAKTYQKLIYQDYTNLNQELIEKYKLDISFFEKMEIPQLEMDEIPVMKLPLLLEASQEIIKNGRKKKEYTFNMKQVNTFIETASPLIAAKIEEYLLS